MSAPLLRRLVKRLSRKGDDPQSRRYRAVADALQENESAFGELMNDVGRHIDAWVTQPAYDRATGRLGTAEQREAESRHLGSLAAALSRALAHINGGEVPERYRHGVKPRERGSEPTVLRLENRGGRPLGDEMRAKLAAYIEACEAARKKHRPINDLARGIVDLVAAFYERALAGQKFEFGPKAPSTLLCREVAEHAVNAAGFKPKLDPRVVLAGLDWAMKMRAKAAPAKRGRR